MSNAFSLEQLQAIEVRGGALVSAGAGSGKTAVLIEHLVTWIRDQVSFDQSNEFQLISDLKSLVVITFTVKASQEMKMRLFERIQNLQAEDGAKWKIVKKHINLIYIGTIDGFFAKIINKNLPILPLSVPFVIVSNQEWQDKVQSLYDSWRASLTEDRELKYSAIWASKITNWLISVLSSTPARLEWSKLSSQSLTVENFLIENNNILKKIYEEQNWTQLISDLISISNHLDEKKYADKKWYQFLVRIKSQLTTNDPQQQVEITSHVLSEFKGMRVPASDDLTEVAQSISAVRDFIKDLSPIVSDWKLCIDNSAQYFWQDLVVLIQKLFKYVEINYGRVPGFCFSDLSYYTQKILLHDKMKSNIPYYVVVDELQDTSELQLAQIYSLAGKDAKNLYGVGDIKQAIYGFRGGQSHVFFEFEKIVNNNRIELFDNYRSHKRIVEFNNFLFSALFTKTKSFEQISKASYQDREIEAVEILRWDIGKDYKVNEWQQEILEFYALVEKIKVINSAYPDESIAVLFRTNAQIKKFSSLLSQEGLSFQVQWKIAFEEDPLFQVFNLLMLLGSAAKKTDDLQRLEKLLSFYMSLISSNPIVNLILFQEEWKMFDAYNAFVRLMNRHQIANAYQAPFIEILKEKSIYSKNEFSVYLIWLDEIKNEEILSSWTLPFDAKGKLPITLQTIHASKGLQYDHVLLARISTQTNGNRRTDLSIGEMNPYALKEFTFLKNAWKTPCFYYEEKLKKQMAKEESYRLFYVACTRAKKSLTISLSTNISSESWGEQVFSIGTNLGVINTRSLDDKLLSIIQKEIRLLPIFEAKIYRDWRGQFRTCNKEKSELKLIPSLSVTSMIVYERCPMKYYFKNILQLDEERLAKQSAPAVSNSSRGITTHQIIQDYLNGEKSYEQSISSIDGDARDYFKANAKDWKKFIEKSDSIEIEKELRFSWKGNIILGTPDLYLISSEGVHVWDFKTGLVEVDDIEAYQMQLKWYAYAIFQKSRPSTSSIFLKIIALDEKRTFDTEINFPQLERELTAWWNNFSNYTTKKLSHCSKCSYQVYCTK